MGARVARAVELQRRRYAGLPFSRNARLPPGFLERYCPVDPESSALLVQAVNRLGLSSRAYHAVLRIARTIADLAECERIAREHLLEAIQHRRYGDADTFWNYN